MFHQSRTADRRPARVRSLLIIATAGTFLAACDDYLERRDTITLGVGDSIEVNKATQTIDRWPSAARQDRWLSDGERSRIAVDRYRNRTPVRAEAAIPAGTAASTSQIGK